MKTGILLSCALAWGVMAQAQSPLETLGVRIRGSSREFAFTNKASAFYSGETNDANRSGWQGFNVSGFEFLHDYEISVNGRLLDRTSCTTTVYPDYLERQYPGGVREELRMVDSIAMVAVVISTPKPSTVELSPFITDARSDSALVLSIADGGALLARKRHLLHTARENYPVWFAIAGSGLTTRGQTLTSRSGFSPLALLSSSATTHTIAFAVADDRDAAQALASGYELKAAQYSRERRSRMEQLLDASPVSTGDAGFDRALAWAKLSLDALIMNQGGRGIFAGLPWFNNYWGRDTFISLPGATLVTGRFSLAREILRSFAQFQQTDSLSSDYGRVPNIVTTTEKAYNTADATPRFVMMAKDYVERSGDSTFMLEVCPDVIRSIEGTLKYHVDAEEFLVHADAETWMDAVGPDGPWSPRGNRANDVQALWAEQLRAGIWFATRLGDPVSARRWDQVLKKLERNFPRFFLSHHLVADRLRPDGTRDMRVRPNQIFCAPLLDDSMQARVTRVLTNQLTYRYGVASLAQDDPDFHPYHQHPPYYPKDAAYHNGTVWTWLQGPLISSLCRFGRQDVAWELTCSATHLLLDRGAVGTMPELLDAVPIPPSTEPRLSGTFSQAWSLAEFIRNFYDDYLGVRVDRLNRTVTLRPHLPGILHNIRAGLHLDGETLTVELHRTPGSTSLALERHGGRFEYRVLIDMAGSSGDRVQSEFSLPGDGTARWTMQKQSVKLAPAGIAHSLRSRVVRAADYSSLLRPMTFLLPVVRPGLKSLRGPRYTLIPHSEIKAITPKARVLFDVADPAGDDMGSGHYRYPLAASFEPGSFDIRHATIGLDSSTVSFVLRFRSLSNPGWHPEYGFQLTMVAVAIHEPNSAEKQNRDIGHNAAFTLDAARAYQRLILVGGGVQVENGRGEILAAYVPQSGDESNPLGNTKDATVSFSLPVALIGRPDSTWSFTILAGAQDDHGGAGIGEFRTVRQEAGEWNGGGRRDPDDSNVYDVLQIP